MNQVTERQRILNIHRHHRAREYREQVNTREARGPLCRCGSYRVSHGENGDLWCNVDDCNCSRFTEIKEEPV